MPPLNLPSCHTQPATGSKIAVTHRSYSTIPHRSPSATASHVAVQLASVSAGKPCIDCSIDGAQSRGTSDPTHLGIHTNWLQARCQCTARPYTSHSCRKQTTAHNQQGYRTKGSAIAGKALGMLITTAVPQIAAIRSSKRRLGSNTDMYHLISAGIEHVQLLLQLHPQLIG